MRHAHRSGMRMRTKIDTPMRPAGRPSQWPYPDQPHYTLNLGVSHAQGLVMAEQEYRPGGAGPIQPATPDVQEIVNKVCTAAYGVTMSDT